MKRTRNYPFFNSKLSTYAFAAILLFAVSGCRHGEKEFTTTLREDSRQMILTSDDEYWPDGDTLGVENSYSLAWPSEGMLTPEAERELLLRCFGDSTATTFDEAADRWLNLSWLYEDDQPDLHKKIVDTLPRLPYNYSDLKSEYSASGNIGTFSISQEINVYHAAHGIYFDQYVNIDLNTRQVIHLSDLVDTALLGEVIVRAVEDLTVNKDVLDCLFDDYQQTGRLPVPEDFFIDSTRSTITLVYQLYEIAPYACGIQNIVLPIFWLSKHIPLTPYAKELFGEGCSL